MMKKVKRQLASLFMVIIMAMSLCMTAFAEQTGTLTINGTTAGKTYDLYRVFDLTQDGEAYSYTVNTNFSGFEYTDSDGNAVSANNLYEYISTNKEAADKLSKLAQALAGYAIENQKTPDKTVNVSAESTGTTTEVEDLPYGYYVMNPKGAGNASGNYATMFSMGTLAGSDSGSTMITVKAEYPTVEKTSDSKTSFDASIGDEITFTLTSKVPDLTGYKWYEFRAIDTLSRGLTYVENSASVKIGENSITDFTATKEETKDDDGNVTSTEVTFALPDLVELANAETNPISIGDEITITYKATLNENAVASTATENTAKLVYTDDPSYTQKHGIDDPGDKPTGESGESKTSTYTAAIRIKKVDGSGNSLTGAAFKISGEGVNLVVTEGIFYTEIGTDEEYAGTIYYKLKDGTYISTPSTEETAELYEEDGKKYKKETKKTISADETNSTVQEAYVKNEDGTLTFTGLGAGEYAITETVVPNGYNQAEAVTYKLDFDGEKFTCVNAIDNSPVTVTDGVAEITIVNQSGSVLPSTGGTGTTMFYVIGFILAAGAAILLITKRRMEGKES